MSGTLASDSRTLMGLENCVRKPPAHRPVEPAPRPGSRSRRITDPAPAAARWYAALAPTAPPPTTTTSATRGRRGSVASIIRCSAPSSPERLRLPDRRRQASPLVPSCMQHADVLHDCVGAKRLEALLAPEATPLVAAERQLDPATGAVDVDVHPRAQPQRRRTARRGVPRP